MQISIVYVGITGKRRTGHKFMDTTPKLTVLMNKMSVMVKVTEPLGFEHMDEEKTVPRARLQTRQDMTCIRGCGHFVMSQNYNIYFLQAGEYFERNTKNDPTKPRNTIQMKYYSKND